MADIVDELKTYLKTKVGVTNLVGAGVNARIFRDKPRQGTAKPFIIIAKTTGDSNEHLNGITGLASAAVHVWACDSTPSGASTLDEAIRLAPVQCYRGTMGTTRVGSVTCDDSNSGLEKSNDKDETPAWYWASRVYRITHDEATS